MPTVDQQRFVSRHQSQRLDPDKVAADAGASQALQAAGISVEALRGVASSSGSVDAAAAFQLVSTLPPSERAAAASALSRLLADPDLQPIDRPTSVFGAMLRSKVDDPGVKPPVDLGKPVTVVGPGAAAADTALVYVSATSVESAADPGALSALGTYGPLGAYGPLADLGAVGDNWWNASNAIDSAYGSSDSAWDGTVDGAPLSSAGPLGERGPLSDVYFDGALFDADTGSDLARSLRGLGESAVLGPLGPLGPLGALGPLGPVGAHGFGTDRDGSFVDRDGAVQRTIDVWYDDDKSTKNTFELYERYSADFAKQMTDNDTSFMVEGRLAYAGRGEYEPDEFSFTSQSDQLVTVCVVPEKSLDDFDFEITDQRGKVLVRSDSDDLIDWAQLEVKKGTKLSVRVKLKDSAHWLSKDYRLYVTGSGERFAPKSADQRLSAGPHIRDQGDT